MVVTLGQQYNVGEKPTAILYTYINHHAEPPIIVVHSQEDSSNNVDISTIEPYKNRGLGILVWFDGTNIDIISTILLTVYYNDWWLCMVINISVQYNSGGFLPDIILLTQGYYHWGTRLNTM